MKACITSTGWLGHKATFALDQQQELAKDVLRLAELISGVTLVEEWYDFAEASNIKNSSNSAAKIAGKGCLTLFLKEICTISLRIPKGNLINRINAFNHYTCSKVLL
jgi:hypothetical protein